MPSTKDYIGMCISTGILGVTVGALVGALGIGLPAGISASKPKTVYVGDINEDKKQDVVIRTNHDVYIFLGQEDGSLKRLEDVEAESIESVKIDIQNIRTRRALESLKSIVDGE